MRRSGFTLVEMLLAIVILAVVLASVARYTGQYLHTVSTSTTRTAEDPRLTNGFVATTPAPFAYGAWVKWPGYGAGNSPAALHNKNVHPLNGGGTTGGGGRPAWPIISGRSTGRSI